MLYKYPKGAINKVSHQQQEKKEGKRKKQNPPNKYPAKMPYRCGRIDCDEEYIGESSRTFGEWFKEH